MQQLSLFAWRSSCPLCGDSVKNPPLDGSYSAKLAQWDQLPGLYTGTNTAGLPIICGFPRNPSGHLRDPNPNSFFIDCWTSTLLLTSTFARTYTHKTDTYTQSKKTNISKSHNHTDLKPEIAFTHITTENARNSTVHLFGGVNWLRFKENSLT